MKQVESASMDEQSQRDEEIRAAHVDGRATVHDADRELYERTKRELAARRWRYVQHYADAKSAVVEEIIGRARSDAKSLPAEGYTESV